MSADNYYLIRRRGKRFAVTCEFMSCEKPWPVTRRGSARWFDDVVKASDWAEEQYSEYGVHHSRDVERCYRAALKRSPRKKVGAK